MAGTPAEATTRFREYADFPDFASARPEADLDGMIDTVATGVLPRLQAADDRSRCA